MLTGPTCAVATTKSAYRRIIVYIPSRPCTAQSSVLPAVTDRDPRPARRDRPSRRPVTVTAWPQRDLHFEPRPADAGL